MHLCDVPGAIYFIGKTRCPEESIKMAINSFVSFAMKRSLLRQKLSTDSSKHLEKMPGA
jgi:hypothetical protein